MIVALEGILESRGIDSAVIKVGPLSLRIHIPQPTLNQLGTVGNKIYLHTHLYVKEDNIALFGFASEPDLLLFQNLISVAGIGPRAAMGLLSALNPEQLISAITGGDVDILSQVPGIGKKMAGRIVLELKGKLEKEWGGIVAPVTLQANADVVAALTSLGYSTREATQAISALPADQGLDLEERVKLALQRLATM
jgi:Holliday junction DNA helicase RuvA